MKKLIIAGGRDFRDSGLIVDHMNDLIDRGIINEKELIIISGTAQGADMLGYNIALENNLPILEYPALWNIHGRSAGYIRNYEMAKVADMLLVFWDGRSRGTGNMIQQMERLGKPTYIVMYNIEGNQ